MILQNKTTESGAVNKKAKKLSCSVVFAIVVYASSWPRHDTSSMKGILMDTSFVNSNGAFCVCVWVSERRHCLLSHSKIERRAGCTFFLKFFDFPTFFFSRFDCFNLAFGVYSLVFFAFVLCVLFCKRRTWQHQQVAVHLRCRILRCTLPFFL